MTAPPDGAAHWPGQASATITSDRLLSGINGKNTTDNAIPAAAFGQPDQLAAGR